MCLFEGMVSAITLTQRQDASSSAVNVSGYDKRKTERCEIKVIRLQTLQTREMQLLKQIVN
jgi:hypothetical protein